MESTDKNKQPKSAESADYNVENPQELNVPKYNSTTETRNSNELPFIENLDNGPELDDDFRENSQTPADDKSLHGEGDKTDLGNGEPDDPEDEKIIRT
jgi:hypothetical protein